MCAAVTAMAAVLAEPPSEPQQTTAGQIVVKTDAPKAQAELDSPVLRDKAMRVMETYCFACHGPEKQQGDVRFDALETIDPVDQQKLYENAKKAMHLQKMPPEKAKQPSEAEHAVFVTDTFAQMSHEQAPWKKERSKELSMLRDQRRRHTQPRSAPAASHT